MQALTVRSMRLLRVPEPFDDPDWLFEVKYDGFRALARVDGHRCTLTSRNGHTFESWPRLRADLAERIQAKRAIIDGELVCLDAEGRSRFKDLLFRRHAPCFAAFDLLMLDGRDLRDLPLFERKRQLRAVAPPGGPMLFVEHIEQRGVEFYRAACRFDLEGIVAK